MSVDKKKDLARTLKAMGAAAPRYRQAHLYYEADAPEVFASQRMRQAMRRNGMTLQMNLSKMVVDSVIDRLEVRAITTTDADSKTDDELIQAVQKANKFQLQHVNWMRKACTYGDGYVMVWPKDNAVSDYSLVTPMTVGAADNELPTYRHTFKPEDLRLIYQDPQCVRVFYNRDDPMLTDFVAKRWEDDDGYIRIDLYYGDRIECYVSKENDKNSINSEFRPFAVAPYYVSPDDEIKKFEEDHIMPNPFGIPPFFHFRTDSDDYGQPEHKHFYPIHDAIHKLALGHISGVDYQAFPQRYALMNPDTDTSEAARLDEGYFSYDLESGGTTEDFTGEGASQFSADPGSVWMANDVKAFGQFDVADAKNFTEPMEFYLRMGATVTNTPLHYFEAGGTVPSGEALRTEEAPFIKKVKNRQLSFGDTFEEMFTFVLQLLGRTDRTVKVDWLPAETWDDSSSWEVATQKQAAGVPVEQTLLENGYTPAQTAEWRTTGQGDLPQRVQLFYQVGESMASFATAVSAGVMTQEQVVEIMGALLADISAGGGEDDRVEPPANPIPPEPEPQPIVVASPDGQPHNQEQMSNEAGQQKPQRIMNKNAPNSSRPTLAPGTKGGK